MYKENPLRQLAKSNKWQLLYLRSKDTHGVQLFKNHSDFTTAQLALLQWLEVYKMLYEDLAMGEPFINEKVIEDEIYADAYLLLRKKRLKEKKRKNSKPKKSGIVFG